MKMLFAAITAALSVAMLNGAEAPAQPEIVAVHANNVGNAFKTIKLPAMELKEGEKAILTFKAWIPSNSNAGWTRALMVRLNGKPVTNDNALIRKEIIADFGKGSIEKMPLLDNKNHALIFYAKDTALPMDKRITSDREQGFTCKFDVSNMVSAERENYLTLHNVRLLYAMRNIFKNPKYEFIVNISDIKLTAEK